MNILFVFKKDIHGEQEPLGILYLAACLKAAGHEVYLEDISEKKLYALILEKNIKILAISCMNTNYYYYQDISRKIKIAFPNILVVWGGPAPTYCPEMIFENPIDIVCRGEGEIAMVELVSRIERGRDFSDIPNLWIKKAGEVIKNDVGPLMNLDDLPHPARELTNKFSQFRNSPIRVIMASRGCPFSCSFCFNEDFRRLYVGNGPVMRRRSVGHIIEELLELKQNYRAKFFYFIDDIFPYQEPWLTEFAQRYPREVALPFTIVTSAAFVREAFVDQLKKAGCVSLNLAVECGNERIRREILNKAVSNEQIRNAFKIAKAKGLGLSSYNMIGLPGSEFEQELETLDLNLELQADTVHVSFCLPLSNTKLGKIARDAGLVSEEIRGGSWFDSLPLQHKNKEQLEKFARLFPFIIAFPRFRKHLETLLKIPIPKAVLKFSANVIHGYKLRKKIFPVRLSFKEATFMAVNYLRRRWSK